MRCDECGQDHDRCLGHRKGSDPLEPCGGWPISGSAGRKCRMHGGGKSSRHGRAAARRVVQQKAMGEIGKLIAKLEIDPASVNYADVLAEQVTTAHVVVAILKLEVAALDTGELYGPDHLGDARPHVLMNMLRDWTSDAAKLSKMAIDAGVDERRVRLAEDRGAQLAAVLEVFAKWVLARVLELGLEESAGVLVRGEIPGALRTAITTTLTSEAG